MNAKYRDALPLLQEKVSVELEEISGTDLYYNDGDSRVSQSLFKLLFPNAVVYIHEKGFWVSYGSLSNEEHKILNEWLLSCL